MTTEILHDWATTVEAQGGAPDGRPRLVPITSRGHIVTPLQWPSGDAAHDASDAARRLRSTLRRRLRFVLSMADMSMIVLSGLLTFVVQARISPVPDHIIDFETTMLLISLPVFALAAHANQLYRARSNERRGDEWRNIFRTNMFGVGFIVIAAFVAQATVLSRFWISLFAATASVALIVEREIARRIFNRLRSAGRLRRRIAMLGVDEHAHELAARLQARPELGYDVAGVVDLESDCDIAFASLTAWLDEVDANGVIISPSSFSSAAINRLTRRLTDSGFHTNVSSVLHDIDPVRVRPQHVGGSSMLYVEPIVRGGWRGAAKRAFDVSASATLLLLTSPVLVASALLVKLESPGPVVFRQQRVGRDGEEFEVMKIRSMYQNAEARLVELLDLNEADGPLFKIEHDPRITKVGRWLRKLSIDELPQLVNVLRGEMSLVGPRPALPGEVDAWDDDLRDRLRVLPGITGLWQVSGRATTTFDEYRRLDLYYVDNWSLTHDVKICFKTVSTVLSGSTAS